MCAVVVAYEQDEHRLIEEINRVCSVLLLLLLLLFFQKVCRQYHGAKFTGLSIPMQNNDDGTVILSSSVKTQNCIKISHLEK